MQISDRKCKNVRRAKQKSKLGNSLEGSKGQTAERQITMGRNKITAMHVSKEEYNNDENGGPNCEG